MPLKWIPRSKSGASKSRPLWAAHTSIGNVWEYPPGAVLNLQNDKLVNGVSRNYENLNKENCHQIDKQTLKTFKERIN